MVTQNPGANGIMQCMLSESQSLQGILSVHIRPHTNSMISKKEQISWKDSKNIGKAVV